MWIWLPGKMEPVLAGQLKPQGGCLFFGYDRDYMAREDAIALYCPELPLKRGNQPPSQGMLLPSCIRDAAPDAWGRRVVLNTWHKMSARSADPSRPTELDYLLIRGFDRVGALDFQPSGQPYQPRAPRPATLQEVEAVVSGFDQGRSLPPELADVLEPRVAVGGARPKVTIEWRRGRYIAKFAARADNVPAVKAEFLTMRLAAEVGLEVAPVSLVSVAGRGVLLVERFDRVRAKSGWCRRAMVSALTLFGLDEMMARYASYEDLAAIVRRRFSSPEVTLRELFGRLVFNVLVGNTDDHARNHAAFWDGETLRLTPAYDICPQNRTGGEASQAMRIVSEERKSQLYLCLEAANNFSLTRAQAIELIAYQIQTIVGGWDALVHEADLAEEDQHLLWGRAFFNPFIFHGLEGAASRLASIPGMPESPRP